MALAIIGDGGFDYKAKVCTFIGLTGLGPFPSPGNDSSSGAGSPAIPDSVGRGRRTRTGRADWRSRPGSAGAASTTGRKAPDYSHWPRRRRELAAITSAKLSSSARASPRTSHGPSAIASSPGA
jgi:hypothetical protein